MQSSHFSHKHRPYYWTILVLIVGLLGVGVQAAPTAADCAVQTDVPQAECEALLSLYNSTDGPNWTDHTGWNDTNTPCSWYGVTCEAGHVLNLVLDDNQLNGTIPDLSALMGLERINLGSNQLSGPVPDFSASASLIYLALDSNQLNGSIPDFSALTSLEHINLGNNQLDGMIPDFSALVNLQYLYLNDNQLSGSIPNLSTLTSLQMLDLGNNQLEGTIPDFTTLTNLRILYLDNNLLSNSIPDISTLTLLQYLSFRNNQLSGSIPALSTLTSLKSINLGKNQLSGPIPDLSALTALQLLYLNDNQLEGSLPDLDLLTDLQFLWLGNNRLSGAIPDLNLLTELHTLGLENNQLSGSVPVSVCQVLTSVDLEYNKLAVDTAAPCVDVIALDWKDTQTVPPTHIEAGLQSADAIRLTWDAITYVEDGGYYEVWGKEHAESTYTLMRTTTDKTVTSAVLDGLQPGVSYDFVIRTFTPAHDNQQNDLMSVYSTVITAEIITVHLPVTIN